MPTSLFSPWPSYTEEEIAAVTRVLRSNRVNYWTGKECREFESEFAAWVGCRYAVALANGTVALDLALKVLEIGHGDEVVVTPRGFIASVSCVVTAGARPVFADIDRDSQNITADSIRSVLTKRTKAIICVHLAGWPCDMDSIVTLAQERGLYMIEDCAQAHGARYHGQSIGNIGQIGAWSFCQDKIVTTGGEGGMFTTNSREWYERAWSYKDHGKSRKAVNMRQQPSGFQWLHESFGTNWRMTEIQAAIGRIQLSRMLDWHASRRGNAEAILAAARKQLIFRVPEVPSDIEHAWYKLYIFVQPKRLHESWSRDRIMSEINVRGVPCYSGSCPEVYLEKAFNNTSYRPKTRLPIAKELGDTSLLFLVHPTLRRDEIELTKEVITEVGQLALR